MALTLAKTVAKAVFAGGALYVTVDQGVWSTSPQASSKALTKVKTSVIPVTSEYIEKAPSLDTVNDKVLEKWNAGVQTTFTAVSSAPEFTRSKIVDLKKTLTSS